MYVCIKFEGYPRSWKVVHPGDYRECLSSHALLYLLGRFVHTCFVYVRRTTRTLQERTEFSSLLHGVKMGRFWYSTEPSNYRAFAG